MENDILKKIDSIPNLMAMALEEMKKSGSEDEDVYKIMKKLKNDFEKNKKSYNDPSPMRHKFICSTGKHERGEVKYKIKDMIQNKSITISESQIHEIRFYGKDFSDEQKKFFKDLKTN